MRDSGRARPGVPTTPGRTRSRSGVGARARRNLHPPRPPRPRGTGTLPGPFLRVLLPVLGVIALGWALANDDQRRGLLVAFGIADSREQAEATGFSLIGPGFTIELLPALPMTPMRYRLDPAGPAQPVDPGPAPALAARPVPEPAFRPASGPASGPSAGHAADEAGGREHAPVDDPCARGRATNPSRARPPVPLYRYTDADGRPVFSDQVPADTTGPASIATPAGASGAAQVGRFSADYDYQGLTPPTGFQTQLEIDLAGVFRFLARDLRLGAVEPVHVGLRIVDGERRFAAATRGTGLGGADISGFYQFSTNQAVVRWQGEAGTRAVARHEIAHLALGNWLGHVPLWLNEGLAELVERMQFQQNFAIAATSPRDLGRLRGLAASRDLPRLATFLAADRAEWQRWGYDVTYPYAWSLVHFLVQEPARAAVLSDLLRALAEHRCQAFDANAWLADAWPGGLAGLESDWRRWLHGNESRAVQF